MYTPKPIDSEIINLPPYLEQAIELLATNVHDIWAQKRIEEGWSLGPRNDTLKQNPCLVPYDELPESEKDYDRKTVTTTVKAMIALGYKIEKRDNE
ncbi:MAG: Ryanodine receptor Ryr [Nitrospirae bacterium]|nr:Ryanodine receptor Ryr [Nitrospirota bacterium]